jgi:hypothetical protein
VSDTDRSPSTDLLSTSFARDERLILAVEAKLPQRVELESARIRGIIHPYQQIPVDFSDRIEIDIQVDQAARARERLEKS